MRFDYDLSDSSLVVDLGGYEGQWCSDIYARYRCRVVVFEPVRTFAEQIERRFARNPAIEVRAFGLAAHTRKETISLGADGSSMFRMSRSGHVEQIELVDVNQWFADERIGEVDLMKINTEGGEYELLERMIDVGLIGRVRNIQVQFHRLDAASEPRMRRIQERLSVTHVPTYQYTFVWENWARKTAT
jgi:FkbM family methyltransferase